MPEGYKNPFSFLDDNDTSYVNPFDFLEGEEDEFPYGVTGELGHNYVFDKPPPVEEFVPAEEYYPEISATRDIGVLEGIWKTAYNESITRVALDALLEEAGMVEKEHTTAYDLGTTEIGPLSQIAGTMLSFLMPVDLGITFLPGAAAGKYIKAVNSTRTAGKLAFNKLVKSGVAPEMAQEAILKGSSRLMHNLAFYGTGDATYGFVRDVANQYDADTDFADIDYQQALIEGAKQGLMGATLGATETLYSGARSRIGKVANLDEKKLKRWSQDADQEYYKWLKPLWSKAPALQKKLTGQISQKTMETSAIAYMAPLLHNNRVEEESSFADDWIKTAGFVFGFPAAMKTPGKFMKLAREALPESSAVKQRMVELADRMTVGDFRVVEAINKRIEDANLAINAGRDLVGKGFSKYPVQVGNRVVVSGRHSFKGQTGLVTDIQRTSGGRDYAWVSFPTGRKRISLKSLNPEPESTILTGPERIAAGAQTKHQIADEIINAADTIELSHPQLLEIIHKVTGKTPEGLFKQAGTGEDFLQLVAGKRRQYLLGKLEKGDGGSFYEGLSYSELYRVQQAVKYGTNLTEDYLKKFQNMESSLSPDAQSRIYDDPHVPGGQSTAEYLNTIKNDWVTPIADVIAKMGRPGKVIAQLMKDVDFQKDKYKAQAIQQFDDVLKILDKGGFGVKVWSSGAGGEKIYRKSYDIILGALEPELYRDVITRWERKTGRTFDAEAPAIKEAVAVWKDLTKKVGKDIIAENVMVKDPETGKKRLMQEDDLLDVYFRRVITPEFRELINTTGPGQVMESLAEQLIIGSGDGALIKKFNLAKEISTDSSKKQRVRDKAKKEAEDMMLNMWQGWGAMNRVQETSIGYSSVDKVRKLNLRNNKLVFDGKEYKVFQDDFDRVGRTWIEQSANYKFSVRAYGQDLQKAGLLLSAVKNATRNNGDVEYVRRAINWQIGHDKPIGDMILDKGVTDKISRGATGFVAWTALSAPPSGLKNIVTGQGANIGTYGILNSIHGAIDMLTYNPFGKNFSDLFKERGLGILNVKKNLKDSYDLARKSGALLSGQRSLELSSLAGGKLNKWNPGLMYPTELFNRVTSYFNARRTYQESIKALSGDTQWSNIWTETRARGLLEDYFGMQGGMIKKAVRRYKTHGSFSDELMERGAYFGQLRTQGSTAVPYMPAWTQKNPNLARPLTLFQRMAYRSLYNIRDGVAKPLLHGNVLPLVRYSLALGLGGNSLYEFSKFLVGERAGIKAETEKGNMDVAYENFMRGEGLAILTSLLDDNGLSYNLNPAMAKYLKDGVLLMATAVSGKPKTFMPALEKNLDNVAFLRMINQIRGHRKAKGEEYLTDAFGLKAVKAVKTKGATQEGMLLQEKSRSARDIQYHFAEKYGYERAERGKLSMEDYINSRYPYYADLKEEIYEGDSKSIAKSFDSAFMYIQATEENNGLTTVQARKKTIDTLKSQLKRFKPITLPRSSHGRQQSKYSEFMNNITPESRKIVDEAQDLWQKRLIYINKALMEHSHMYNGAIISNIFA